MDPDIAQVDRQSNVITAFRLGRARLVAQTVAYGVSKADTVTFTITSPLFQGIEIAADSTGTVSFDPNAVALQPNGYVFWYNSTGQSVDVTFDDPTNIAEVSALCTPFTNMGVSDLPVTQGTFPYSSPPPPPSRVASWRISGR